MTIYLLHGFRWKRNEIMIYLHMRRKNESASNWIMAPGTQVSLYDSIQEELPHVFNALPNLRFIEEYHHDQEFCCAPYAYVADTVHEVKLSVDIQEVSTRGIGNETWSAIAELRDKLAEGTPLGWYVVNCTDEERTFESSVDSDTNGGRNGSIVDNSPEAPSPTTTTRPRGASLSRSFKSLFKRDANTLKKSTSTSNLKQPAAMNSSASTVTGPSPEPSVPPPPIPAQYQAEIAAMRARKEGTVGKGPRAQAPGIGMAR
ncbi:MAG: hypothetical protein Q9162_006965 [Coniocarpon cinnabarinum]